MSATSAVDVLALLDDFIERTKAEDAQLRPSRSFEQDWSAGDRLWGLIRARQIVENAIAREGL